MSELCECAECVAARKWIVAKTGVGGGPRPLSFLIASHETMADHRDRAFAKADRSEAEFCACKALLIAAQKRAERAEAERAAAQEAIDLRDHNDNGLFMEAWRQKSRAVAAEQRASEARALLANVGRYGTPTDVWTEIQRALAGLPVEPARRPEQKEIQRDGDTPSAPSTAAIRAQALEDAAQAAEAIGKECEQEWLDLGGEEGGPLWMQTIPSRDYVRNCRRYAGAGGADAAEEIAKRIRAGAARDAQEAAPLSNLPPSPTGDAE